MDINHSFISLFKFFNFMEVQYLIAGGTLLIWKRISYDINYIMMWQMYAK